MFNEAAANVYEASLMDAQAKTARNQPPGQAVTPAGRAVNDAYQHMRATLDDYLNEVRTTQAEGAKLASDDLSQLEGLERQWTELRADNQMVAKRRDAEAALDAYDRALYAAALPTIQDPTRRLLARQEVEARLDAAGSTHEVIDTLRQIASEGGDLAREAASSWGRAQINRRDPQADADGHHAGVAHEAILAAADRGDGLERAAARAWVDLDDVRAGLADAAHAEYTVARQLSYQLTPMQQRRRQQQTANT